MGVALTRLLQMVGLRAVYAIVTGILRAMGAFLATLPLWKETERYFYWTLRKIVYGV